MASARTLSCFLTGGFLTAGPAPSGLTSPRRSISRFPCMLSLVSRIPVTRFMTRYATPQAARSSTSGPSPMLATWKRDPLAVTERCVHGPVI